MGKRLPKRELLAEIQTERHQLMETLEQIPRRLYSRGQLNEQGWSIKDVLTHLLDWEVRVVQWYELGARGEIPELPAPGFTWRELPALNAQIRRSHRRKSVETVLREFDTVHQQTLAAIKRMTDKQLTTLSFYHWTGKSWTLSDYLRANTSSHYRWARTKIRKWFRQYQAAS